MSNPMPAPYDNNFGSNPAGAWELPAQELATLATYVDRGGEEETSFDDLFDGPTYRAAQTTFAAQGHRRMPHGHTHYRPAAQQHIEQGIPAQLSSAHWDRLPVTARPAAQSGSRLAWAVAQDSAWQGSSTRPVTSMAETGGAGGGPPAAGFYAALLPGGAPAGAGTYSPLPRAAPAAAPAPSRGRGPSARTYHFAG